MTEQAVHSTDATKQHKGPPAMHHFGVLVPSTNTTVEIEYGRLLPSALQVHVARIPLLGSGAETTPRSGDADVDYQARLLGSAKVEVLALAQTAAGLSSDDFDEQITKRMSEAAGVPGDHFSPSDRSCDAGSWRAADRARVALSDSGA